MCIELQYNISIKHQYKWYNCKCVFATVLWNVIFCALLGNAVLNAETMNDERFSATFYFIVIIRAFFQFDARLSCLTLLCSLRFSYFVCTISENVRFTCNSRTIIPLIVCDRSTDLTCSLLLPAFKKAYRPLADLTSRARYTHSLSTFYIFPLRFNFHRATTPRQTGIPSPHDL
jgi:hypothetical protein